MNITILTPRFTEDEPRLIPYKTKWGSVQNTVFWFDLKIAQDKDLNLIHQRAHTILLHNTMPAESLVIVVKRIQDDLQGEIL